MANTGFKGVDSRQSGNQLVFRASLKDSAGAKVTTGTTTLRLFEVQSDGTIKSYDFADNTFKTTALTTATLALTHRQGNNSTYDTGIWTAALSTLTGLTPGGVYLAQVSNSSAVPPDQEREFVYGAADANVVESLSAALQPYDYGVASATVSTITLATPDSAGVAVPDTDQFEFTEFVVQSGMGVGQKVLTTTAAAGALTYNIVAADTPIPLDATSKLNRVRSWKANMTYWNSVGAGTLPPTATQNADAYLDRVDGVETGITPRMVLRGITSTLAGLNTGAGTGTEVFKAAGNPGTTRTTYVIDANGNRTTVTLNW